MSWQQRRIAELADLINGFPFDSSDFSTAGQIPLVRIRDVTNRRFETFVPSNVVPDSVIIRNGDVVIGMDGDFNVVHWERGKAALNQRLCLLRENGQSDLRFLAYALPRHLKVINDLTYATTVKHLSSGQVRDIRLLAPPIFEQRAIADYLDRETARIDTLIEEQQRLIDLLHERRVAEIAELYSMPSRARLRHVLDFAQTGPFGTQLSSDEYLPGGIPVINPSHISLGTIVPDPDVAVSTAKASNLARHRLAVGDIVLGRKGDIDKSALVGDGESGYVCGSDSMLLRPSTAVVPSFLWWFFQSPSAHSQLEQWSVGSTVTGLNQITIAKIVLPLPPLKEQRRIAAYLDEQTAKIDQLIAETERFIELSRERRSALITAAVTGQIDIRDEVA